MKKKLFIILSLSSLLSLTLNTLNTYADTTQRVQNRNPTAIVYNYVNSDDNTTTANVVNRQTQLITKNVAANSSERVFLRKIRLNQAFNASPERTMVVPLTIRVYGYNDVFFNQPFDMSADFSCPYMTIRDDAKWYVNYCTIKSSSTHFVQDGYHFDADGNMSLDGDGEYAYEYYIDYYIDIVIKFKNEFQADHLEFYYQPILALNNHSGTSAKNIAWQFIFNDFVYLYIDNDPAAEAIEEQNEKDEQDRSNLETQQENNEGDAEDGKDEANTTGTSLMGAFTSLVSALGSVHATNCNLPNMQVYTLQLRDMDLCSVNMPTGISALAGIAVSLLIVKLGISLVKRMLALYKEIIG